MHVHYTVIPGLIGLIYLIVLAGIVAAILVTIRSLQRIARAQERAARYLEEIAERLHDRPL